MINITIELNEERVGHLLCTAFEGGANYWYCDLEVVQFPEGKSKTDFEYWHTEVPLEKGGVLGFRDKWDDFGDLRLDLESITKGLHMMQDKYPRHWADFVNENQDAITGDVFLQCCVLGGITYG